MYKTIIIHSEHEAAAHVKYILSRSNLGFSVIASYLNGKRAADGIAKLRPNLVITDCPAQKEHYFDIIKYLHRNAPDTKILLYTSRTDFALAKEALAQGVSGIIAPGDDEELTAALFDVKNQLDRQTLQKKHNRLLERLVVSARKQFLTDIFMGNIAGRENIQKKAKELSLGNQAGIYCPFWIGIPNYDAYITSRWNYDKERFFIAISNFLRPENKHFDVQNIMVSNGEIFYVAISETNDATNFINSLRLHLTNAEHNLKSLMGLTVNWHIGRHFMSFHDFVEHITTPILSNSNIDIEAIKKAEENRTLLLDMYKNVVISAILDKTPRLKEHLSYIVRQIAGVSDGALSETLCAFCDLCIQNMAPHLKESEKINRMTQSLAKSSGAAAQSICTNVLAAVCREADTSAMSASSDTVKRAVSYIEQNFSRDLSLEDVARYLNLNPSYFSRFFKQHTGCKFRDYLIALRIKKAKELLLTGQYKIYEISAMTGYKNSKYFAAQFKAVTGSTPKTFAEKQQNAIAAGNVV